MKQLIVNADGFGFTFGNNRAILEVLEHGFIRSVSVNVTWSAVREVVSLMRHFPHVTVGVHFNLSVGPSILPAAQIPSLVGGDGEFHGDAFHRLAFQRRLNVDEMKRELLAQVGVLHDLGVRITHWDSHQGRHLYPSFFEAAIEVGRHARIPASRSHKYHLVLPPGPRWSRWAAYYARHPRALLSHRAAAWRTRLVRQAGICVPDRRQVLHPLGEDAVHRGECWRRMLETLPAGVNFIECHPGYVDDNLRRYSRVQESRERERALFADSRWLARARDLGVEAVGYEVLSGVREASVADTCR